MRPLKHPVADLPAGTSFEIYQDQDGLRRAAWVGEDGLRRAARVDGRGTLATLTAAGPIYDAHCVALGCNPEDEIPCGYCGEQIAACLTLCPECKMDPDVDVQCGECDTDNEGKPTGYINYVSKSGRGREELCFACGGSTMVEAPYVAHREAALKAARGWKRAQSVELNPVPAGVGSHYSPALEADLAAEAKYGGTLGEGMELELRKLKEDEDRGPETGARREDRGTQGPDPGPTLQREICLAHLLPEPCPMCAAYIAPGL